MQFFVDANKHYTCIRTHVPVHACIQFFNKLYIVHKPTHIYIFTQPYIYAYIIKV